MILENTLLGLYDSYILEAASKKTKEQIETEYSESVKSIADAIQKEEQALAHLKGENGEEFTKKREAIHAKIDHLQAGKESIKAKRDKELADVDKTSDDESKEKEESDHLNVQSVSGEEKEDDTEEKDVPKDVPKDDDKAKELNKEKIIDLKEKIRHLTDSYEKKKPAQLAVLFDLKQITDSKCTNELLKDFATIQRIKARIKYNSSIIDNVDDKDEKKQLKDKIAKDAESAKKLELELSKGKDTIAKENPDNKELQAAIKDEKNQDDKDEKSEASTDDKESEKSTEDKPEKDDNKEQKVKELTYDLKKIKDKIEPIDAALKKAKADGKDQKIIDAIEKNLEKASELQYKLEDELKSINDNYSFDNFDLFENKLYIQSILVSNILNETYDLLIS